MIVTSESSSQNVPLVSYRKIPKISPGAYIFQRPFLRGLFLEGLIFEGAYLRRETDRASLMVGSKFTVFALFYFVFEGNFPSISIFGGVIYQRVFCVTGLRGFYLEGLMHGGAYFRNFTVTGYFISII